MPGSGEARARPVEHSDAHGEGHERGEDEGPTDGGEPAAHPEPAEARDHENGLLDEAHPELVAKALPRGEDRHPELDEGLEGDGEAEEPHGEGRVPRTMREPGDQGVDEADRGEDRELQDGRRRPLARGGRGSPCHAPGEDGRHPQIERRAQERGQSVRDGELAEALGAEDSRGDDQESHRQEPRGLAPGLEERIARHVLGGPRRRGRGGRRRPGEGGAHRRAWR